MLLQSQQVLSNLLQRKSTVQKAVPVQPSIRPVPTWVCRAENDNIVNGPIQMGPGSKKASDPVTAASEGKSAKPVDRSKGLWTRCDKCGVILYIKHLKEHHHICFSCNYHLKMSSQERIDHLIDPGTWRPLDETLSPVDPLEFTDQKPYTDRIREAQDKTGLQDAVRTGTGLLHGIPIALGVMDFSYMGGSMGSVVGEKLTRLIEYATQEGLALMIVSTSGGARMQEGIMSLMQMAKISAALHVHQNTANLLYISILTSPTTGGVTASFGMLGDIIIAEPQAIIGFAGRRVIEQTLQEQLPDDFQTAEYLLEHGLLDLVVPRSFLKGALFEMLDFYKDAPYKRRGKMSFGVQNGVFLDTEEKIRRKLRAWKAAGGAKALDAGAEPSYASLVDSFKAVCAAEEGGAVDVAAVLQDDKVLAEALALARKGRFEFMEPTLPVEATTGPFVVRVADGKK
uniref:CoA carboxyltransferase N-terminal domain-containing protein n=1 Tax=Chlamydomonas leiostraca TaxID=1034604 RepID=A0A7S0S1R5_9CHLO|mmetsp:Transcript_38141/g.96494  ORF Transcript_38141/g.96494 Transcript_38141/m.96494 type:complete len:455 (+) Transcript_38141:169-1533(+)|eukprot:CAMPEP_0202867538 /NCGR_PEP_ID=MMETSP1391-20130828/9487_1 /ASSEMBLY_ACC=CAM_ASM_000867 /TAXON_ID=1034604 /ORGANISM="Chlamydomonas leiostraca, Strain SAG 11-49" /LENGTH=454 /DNA_ID=CAMNT_0049547591 /DNA_START=160 /DNA_END=1524 /DNA_ORIENTATION=+